ncbi:hypothetical protein ACG10_22730 (plasmid) [Azotobacter chroococcum]|nr:hypothetical protein ACG10_22730 [Azotobacter chroococcum]
MVTGLCLEIGEFVPRDTGSFFQPPLCLKSLAEHVKHITITEKRVATDERIFNMPLCQFGCFLQNRSCSSPVTLIFIHLTLNHSRVAN